MAHLCTAITTARKWHFSGIKFMSSSPVICLQEAILQKKMCTEILLAKQNEKLSSLIYKNRTTLCEVSLLQRTCSIVTAVWSR